MARLWYLAAPALLVSLLAPTAGAVNPANVIGIIGTGLPTGVVVGAQGDIYVVTENFHQVLRYSRLGTYMTSWGGVGLGPGQFYAPHAAAMDPYGNIFVLDATSGRIQKFDGNGTYLSEFGLPGSGPGEFNTPHGIALDGDGNIFVADTYNHRVQKFNYYGVYLTQWGGEGSAPGQFELPEAIAVDRAGDVYVADCFNNRIQKFDGNGTFLRQWGTAGTGDGEFQFPKGISIDGGGNVYVTDTNNNRVQRFTTTGVFVDRWGSAGSGFQQFQLPIGVGTAPNGDVYVCDTDNDRVQIYRSRNNQGHRAIVSFGSIGSGDGQFSGVCGAAVAPDGSVFITDRFGNRVEKFTSFGSWVATWGTSGSGNGQFSEPTGVATDAAGNVYVTDHLNARVQKFTPGGAYVSQWGSAGSGPGQFTGLWDIAIDPFDNVYVTDGNRVQRFTTAGGYVNGWTCNDARGLGCDAEGFIYVACGSDHVVRKFRPDGNLVNQWGSFGANPGQFQGPTDVACDTAGYVYVCEVSGNRIQKFTALGGFVAFFAEPGNGFGQLSGPQMMAIDHPGSVYVTDFSNYRIEKFASAPELLEIRDVPGDQGGQAIVTFTRSSCEAPGSGASPTAYGIYRWEQNPPQIVLVASVPIDGVTTTALVSTGANATGTFTGMKEYEVRIQSNVPNGEPIREFSDGCSVDNLAPPAPSPFTAAYAGGATNLHWGASPASDLGEYRLYRGDDAGFAVSPASLIHASPDTGYADVGDAGRYYKIVAADTSGNVSPAAALGPNQTVSAPGPQASVRAFFLGAAAPNPFQSFTACRFEAPAPFLARVSIFDAEGRTVRRDPDRVLEGIGVVRWDGKTASGTSAAPGVYFLQVSGGGVTRVQRIAIVR